MRDNAVDGIHNHGRLGLGGSSRVLDNGAFDAELNIYNTSTVIMQKRSRVGDAGFRAGMAVDNRGRFVMGGASRISGFGSTAAAFVNRARGRLIMRGTSSIHHDRAVVVDDCDDGVEPSRGGGVYNAGTLRMVGSSRIFGDAVEGTGGGVYNAVGGTLIGVRCGTNVCGNTPQDCVLKSSLA